MLFCLVDDIDLPVLNICSEEALSALKNRTSDKIVLSSDKSQDWLSTFVTSSFLWFFGNAQRCFQVTVRSLRTLPYLVAQPSHNYLTAVSPVSR